MADTSVKYFHSEMSGAPILNGTAGSLIAVLDACLVNGWGLITADSVTIANNVATFTRAAGVKFEVGQLVAVAGATINGGSINGEQRVTAVTANSWSFAAPGLANQSAVGTVTAKVAPATWNKTFSGTNKAAYKPSDVTATGCLLRVDDSVAQYSRVIGYESMSDIDTGLGLFPTAAQRSGGLYWNKSNATSSASRRWMLIADSKMMYFAREYHIAYPGSYELYVFGDPINIKSGDAWNCVISGTPADYSSSSPNEQSHHAYGHGTVAFELYAARAYTGLGSAKQLYKTFPTIIASNVAMWSGAVANSVSYPNATDGGLYVTPHYMTETGSFVIRGISPGFWCCPMSVPIDYFKAKDKVTGVTNLTGRTLFTISTYGSGYGPAPVFVDITGPWR